MKVSLLGTEVHSAYSRHDESDDSFVHAILVAAPRYHGLHSYMKTAGACVIGWGRIAVQILMNCMLCAELSCVMSIELAFSHSWINNKLYMFFIKDFEH
jgi:hypothetical protein